MLPAAPPERFVAAVTVEVVSAIVPDASGNEIARALVAVELRVVALAPVPKIIPELAVDAVRTPVIVALLFTVNAVPAAVKVAGAPTETALAELPMVTVCVVVPVPMLVAKLDEALMFTAAPLRVAPPVPVINPEAPIVVAPAMAPAFVTPPALLLIPPLIEAPPEATVRPVRPESVPVIVELPVIVAPPAEIVRPPLAIVVVVVFTLKISVPFPCTANLLVEPVAIFTRKLESVVVSERVKAISRASVVATVFPLLYTAWRVPVEPAHEPQVGRPPASTKQVPFEPIASLERVVDADA
jgi:hypothetical protein